MNPIVASELVNQFIQSNDSKSEEFEASILRYCDALKTSCKIDVNLLAEQIIAHIISYKNNEKKQASIHATEIEIILSALRSYPKICVRDPSVAYYNVFIRGNHYMLSEKIIRDVCSDVQI